VPSLPDGTLHPACTRNIVRMSAATLALVLAALVLATAPESAGAQTCTTPAKLGLSMIIDDSASMSDNDPDELRRAGAELALDLLPDGSVAAAGSFDSGSRTFFEPSEVNGATRSALREQMFFAASGQTNFDLGFELAIRHLGAMPAAVDRKALVFLSDGRDNDGLWYADEPIAAQGIPIYTIAFGDADTAAMQQIAQGDGRPGRLYAVSDDAGLQAAFADIVAELSCRVAKISEAVELGPGETREFPFVIGPSDRGWQGLVTWDEGQFDVSAVRPDGSSLTATSVLNDEVFDSREAFRRELSSRRPAVGTWRLRVTARADNAAVASVSLRIFDQDSGGATVTVNWPTKSLPTVIPRENRLQRGLKTVTQTPFSLWLQPYVGLSGKVSADSSVIESFGADLRAYRLTTPLGSWTLAADTFRWKGPPLTLGDIAVKPPELTTPTPSLVLLGKNATLDQALIVSFAKALELSYRQEFPVEPAYASVTFTGGLNAQAGAYVVDATAWAATRLLAAVGASIPTGGAGATVVAAFTAKQATVALAVRVVTIAQTLRNVYGVVVDNEDLLRQVGQAAMALAAQLGPGILARVKQLVRDAVDALTGSVARAIDRVRVRLSLGVFGHASQVQGARVPPRVRVGGRLAARALRGSPRLRPAPIGRRRVGTVVRLANRYGSSRVRARRLLVAGTFRRRGSIAVASKLPGAPRRRGAMAVLTLQGPGGVVRERLVRLADRRAAARVRLPAKLARGRWQLSLGAYPDQSRRRARVDLAVAEFVVRRSR